MGGSVDAVSALVQSHWPALAAFVRRGGTLFLSGAEPRHNAALEELSQHLIFDPVSVADDLNYAKTLQAQRNLPPAIKEGLKAFYPV